MEATNHNDFIRKLTLLLALLGVFAAGMENDGSIYQILYYTTFRAQSRFFVPICLVLGQAGFWAAAFYRGKVRLEELVGSVWPLIILLPINILVLSLGTEGSFWNLYLTLFLTGITVYRVLSCWRTPVQMSWRLAWLIAILMGLLFLFWTVSWQIYMHERFMLGFHNTGYYFKRLYNTFTWGSFHQINSDLVPFANHCCPGLIFLVPLMKIYPDIRLLIFVQCFAITITGIILMELARRRGVSPLTALGLAFCFYLYPAISQMTLNLTYGFHPPHLALPLMILAYYCFETRSRLSAIILIALVFSLQEHFSLYFFTYGIVLLFTKRWRGGAILATISLAYFLLISGMMPKMYHGEILSLRYYSAAGGNAWEIILSPILKPAVFFSAVFSIRAIQLCFQLFLPLFFLYLFAPKFLFAMIPLLVLNLLRGDLPSTCIALQYQSLNVGMLFLAVLFGLKQKTQDSEINLLKPVMAWLRKHFNPAFLLGAAIAVSFYSSFYFGMLPWSRLNNAIKLPKPETMTANYKAYRDIIRLIPKDRTVTSDDRSRGFFLSHRLTIDFQYPRDIDTDYHVYKVGFWNTRPEVVEKQVRKVLGSGKYKLIYHRYGLYILRHKDSPLKIPDTVF